MSMNSKIATATAQFLDTTGISPRVFLKVAEFISGIQPLVKEETPNVVDAPYVEGLCQAAAVAVQAVETAPQMGTTFTVERADPSIPQPPDVPTPTATQAFPSYFGDMTGYRILGVDEDIKEGDEWILNEPHSHSGGRPRQWRDCEDIEENVGQYTKSTFRRRV